MKTKKLICAILSAGLLSACASGSSLSDSAVSIEPPAPGMTRITVYRDSIFGAAIQPAVRVNGTETGRCQPNGVFYVDVPDGTHEVIAQGETTSRVVIDTDLYDQAYIKCSIGMGIIGGRPQLVPVDAATGGRDVQDLVFTGNYTVN
jgi:hypothetical protein